MSVCRLDHISCVRWDVVVCVWRGRNMGQERERRIYLAQGMFRQLLRRHEEESHIPALPAHRHPAFRTPCQPAPRLICLPVSLLLPLLSTDRVSHVLMCDSGGRDPVCLREKQSHTASASSKTTLFHCFLIASECVSFPLGPL